MENIVEEIKKIESHIRHELSIIKQQIVTQEKPFLTFTETAKYLQISKNTLYAYTSKSLIPHYKIRNRKIYFKIEDLDRFILNHNNKVKSMSELEFEIINYKEM